MTWSLSLTLLMNYLSTPDAMAIQVITNEVHHQIWYQLNGGTLEVSYFDVEMTKMTWLYLKGSSVQIKCLQYEFFQWDMDPSRASHCHTVPKRRSYWCSKITFKVEKSVLNKQKFLKKKKLIRNLSWIKFISNYLFWGDFYDNCKQILCYRIFLWFNNNFPTKKNKAPKTEFYGSWIYAIHFLIAS